MRARFTQAFKIQAVEKVLERANGVTVKAIADELGVGYSTLDNWVALARQQKLEPMQENEAAHMTKEKRPQDWNTEEKLDMVITCAPLGTEEVSELCRKKGIFPHHINQWKKDFIKEKSVNNPMTMRSDNKALRQENKALKKELNRKEKALAETAALLVLQKKVSEIWGSDEDNSQ